MSDQLGDIETPDMRANCPKCGREKADAGDCQSNYHNSPAGDADNPADDEPE
jgi:hypothetical protein